MKKLLYAAVCYETLKLLCSLKSKGFSYSIVNSARSGLSPFITLEGIEAGKHPVMCRYMEGLYNVNRSLPVWFHLGCKYCSEIDLTKNITGDLTGLFITPTNPYRKASKDTLPRWVKGMLQGAGIDMKIFSHHPTRTVSTSRVIYLLI